MRNTKNNAKQNIYREMNTDRKATSRKSRTCIYQNYDNEHKYLIVKLDWCGHIRIKQIIKYNKFDEQGIENYVGDGNYHRWKLDDFKALVHDYHMIKLL